MITAEKHDRYCRKLHHDLDEVADVRAALLDAGEQHDATLAYALNGIRAYYKDRGLPDAIVDEAVDGFLASHF